MNLHADSEHDAPNRSQPRGSWKLWSKLAITALLVGFLYSRLDLRQIVRSLTLVEPSTWLLALSAYLFSQWISAFRWLMLSRALELRGALREFVRLYFEGMFISLCLPTSIGGDVYKAFRLGSDTAGRLRAAVSVFSDRVIGLVALGTLCACGLANDRLNMAPWLAAALVVPLSIAALGLMRLASSIAARFIERFRFAKLQLLATCLDMYVRRGRLFVATMTLSLVVQLLNVMVVMLLAGGMGIDLPARSFFVTVPAVILLTVLPISIGGAGVREGSLALMLGSYGLTVNQGASLGIAWFAVIVAAGLIGGFLYLFDRSKPQLAAPFGSLPILALDDTATLSTTPIAALFAGSVPAVVKNAGIREERRMSLSVVVPVYNEEPNLRPLYSQVTSVLTGLREPYEILFVDDGSTDGSVDVLRDLAAGDRAVKVVYFRRNYGQTAAMNAGLQMATGDTIVTLDADLQNDPADIPMMLAKLREGYDLVHGWRSQRQDKLLSRKIPSKIANWLISRVTRFPVHDLGCTLKAIRREIAQELQLYGEMHRFIPILAFWRGARCAEVVTRHHPRRAGQSKYGLSRTLRVILDLITVKYMIQYLTSPMKLFGMAGLAALGTGGLAAIATTVMKLGYGVDMTGNPLLLLSAFSALAGMQFIMLGMLGELGARTYFESQNKRPYAIRETINFEPRVVPAERLQITDRAA